MQSTNFWDKARTLNEKKRKKRKKRTEIIFCIFFYFMSKCRKIFKALKMNITTKAGQLKSTDQFDSRVKIWKCNFKVHFQCPNFAQVIISRANFIFETLIGYHLFVCRQNVQIIASNAFVIQAHHLEYRAYHCIENLIYPRIQGR